MNVTVKLLHQQKLTIHALDTYTTRHTLRGGLGRHQPSGQILESGLKHKKIAPIAFEKCPIHIFCFRSLTDAFNSAFLLSQSFSAPHLDFFCFGSIPTQQLNESKLMKSN
jgi:hypothetical protein